MRRHQFMVKGKTKTMKPSQVAKARGEVRVPEDCSTLEAAVNRIRKLRRMTTIVLGPGTHRIDGNYLYLTSALSIVGRPNAPKESIVILGGINLKKKMKGTCHLQHLTLRQAKGCGVFGQSSFTMDDVLVDHCGGSGVVANGTGVVGRCTNVEVRQCGCSGVRANHGASILLLGAQTTVHHNSTNGKSGEYGLCVYGMFVNMYLLLWLVVLWLVVLWLVVLWLVVLWLVCSAGNCGWYNLMDH